MFGLGKKKDTSDNKKKDSKQSTVEPAQDVQVRAMPEKFLGVKPGKASTAKKPSKPVIQHKSDASTTKGSFERPQDAGVKRNIIIGVAVIVIIGGGMATAAFFVVRGLSEPDSVPLNNNEPVAMQDQQPDAIPSQPINKENNPEEVVETPTVSEPIEEPIVPQEDVPVITPVLPQEPQINLDPDNDGLSAPEETLFGTSSGIADTDGDGYDDGAEVLNLFDPRFPDGAQLADSNSVKTYLSNEYNYKLLLPTSWIEEAIGTSGSFVRFTSENGDGFFEVSVEENTTGALHAREWYQTEFSVVGNVSLGVVQGQNISGVISPDGLVAYFVNGEEVYTLTYNPAGSTQLQYTTVFKMMINSFMIFENPLEET